MNSIIYLFKYLYAYCSDFTINVANLTGTSYYEVNFFFFIVLYPLLLVVTPAIYFIQKARLRAKKKQLIKIEQP